MAEAHQWAAATSDFPSPGELAPISHQRTGATGHFGEQASNSSAGVSGTRPKRCNLIPEGNPSGWRYRPLGHRGMVAPLVQTSPTRAQWRRPVLVPGGPPPLLPEADREGADAAWSMHAPITPAWQPLLMLVRQRLYPLTPQPLRESITLSGAALRDPTCADPGPSAPG
jgi:hypothetical protein